MFEVFQVPILMLQYALTRAKAVRGSRSDDEGASAIEWAIISAVVVTAAVLIGGIIYKIVSDKGTAIQNCGTVTPGTANGKC